MVVFSALTRKLIREIWHLRGQMIAIVIVVAAGIANFVAMRSVHSSLVLTRDLFYGKTALGNIFVSARRVPESYRDKLAAMEGVAAVETRIEVDVMLDVPGVLEPATGHIVSIPEHGQPAVSRLHLLSGRWISPDADSEVLISSAFAQANKLREGDQFSAVLNGRWRRLTVVGTAVSPEYVLEVQPGTFIIDNKRYGILWMGRKGLSAAFDLYGAFNSAALLLDGSVNEVAIKNQVTKMLERYGSFGALGRDEQTSTMFVEDEIRQIKVQASLVPTIFLGVAVFLLNISLMRLVGTQRSYIAILKAFGYSNIQIAIHYTGFALVATGLGTIVGIYFGSMLGAGLTEMYARFYRFPELYFEMPDDVLLGAAIFAMAAAVLGAIGAVRSALKLPPAEAMRPESPGIYHAGISEKLGISRLLGPVGRMIVRNVERRPVKAAVSILMITLAASILIVGRFLFDTFDRLIFLQFEVAQRDDITLMFNRPLTHSAIHDILHLPGVLNAEPFRLSAVDVSRGSVTKRTVVFGMNRGAGLRQIVDAKGVAAAIPDQGLLLSQHLATRLQVRIGDTVQLSFLEGGRRSVSVPVQGLVDELIGVQAYASAASLSGWLREQGSVSGAYVQVDRSRMDELNAAVKRTPVVASAMVRETALKSFEDTYRDNMDMSSLWIVIFAVIIAFGVVYNSARIALSERGNELASLRVLGFTTGEISVMLLGEQMVLTLVAIPLGMVTGYWLSSLLPGAFATDMLRLPFVFSVRNVGIAAATITSVAALTGILINRRLRKLDLIAVLKTRE